MRVLVCGARDYHDKGKVWRRLDELKRLYPTTLVIIEGEARGADTYAREWAEKYLSPNYLKKFPAQWKIYGRGAGPLRNKQMLEEGKPDLVLAFGGKGGTGTNHMISIAKRAGVPVREYDRD